MLYVFLLPVFCNHLSTTPATMASEKRKRKYNFTSNELLILEKNMAVEETEKLLHQNSLTLLVMSKKDWNGKRLRRNVLPLDQSLGLVKKCGTNGKAWRAMPKETLLSKCKQVFFFLFILNRNWNLNVKCKYCSLQHILLSISTMVDLTCSIHYFEFMMSRVLCNLNVYILLMWKASKEANRLGAGWICFCQGVQPTDSCHLRGLKFTWN